ncbi:hypothetical protein WJX73_007156 [Symbiochloris irregularis]|uniref:SGNH hydrolase-type esterase domain-containing protein n=1 Tax=Symbiochloris irregularis TaxID=706552 RepID=A0AAW1NKE4_9CHLO
MKHQHRGVQEQEWLQALKSKALCFVPLALLGLVAWAVLILRADQGLLKIAHGLRPSNAVPHSSQGVPQMGDPYWAYFHETLVQEVEVAKERGVELVFYGDSITESWRGTNTGQPWEPFAKTPEVFTKHYGSMRTGVYAISGDTAGNLLWRMHHGEGLRGLTMSPQAVVVLIGTNDLFHQPDLADVEAVAVNVSTGATEVVEVSLEQARGAQVLLLGLLPRGGPAVEPPGLQPCRFTAPIEAANERLQAYAASRKRVDFVECGHVFLEKHKESGKVELIAELMPDVLHPSAHGMDLLAQCLQPHLSKAGINPTTRRLRSL